MIFGGKVALFDAYARSYDAWFTTPRGQLVWEIERRLLFSFLRPQPGEEILDAGCGTGLLTKELAACGASVTGIDISPAMLAVAREKTRGFRNVVLAQADVTALPLPSNAFHGVVCFTVLEFVPRPEEALREMWRVLKPGGRMVLGVLNALSPWAWGRVGRGVFAYARFYSYREMRLLIKKTLGRIPLRWAGAVYFPPWCPESCLRHARLFELLGAVFARPFGAVLIFRIEKTP
ncbi:class I SAM-dependent methyltransferase [Thermodesulfitimonas sp.]